MADEFVIIEKLSLSYLFKSLLSLDAGIQICYKRRWYNNSICSISFVLFNMTILLHYGRKLSLIVLVQVGSEEKSMERVNYTADPRLRNIPSV